MNQNNIFLHNTLFTQNKIKNNNEPQLSSMKFS